MGIGNWGAFKIGGMKKGMCLETFSKLSDLITLFLSPRL